MGCAKYRIVRIAAGRLLEYTVKPVDDSGLPQGSEAAAGTNVLLPLASAYQQADRGK